MNGRDFSGMTLNLVSAALVLGTTSTYTTTVATQCAIGGKFATSLAPAANAATPTTDATSLLAFPPLAPNQAVAIVFGVNAAGAIQMCQGPIVGTGVGVGAAVGTLVSNPQFPSLPSNFCPLAYTIVQTAPSAAAWTAGAGSWTAAGVTCSTAQNIPTLPDRPQSA